MKTPADVFMKAPTLLAPAITFIGTTTKGSSAARLTIMPEWSTRRCAATRPEEFSASTTAQTSMKVGQTDSRRLSNIVGAFTKISADIFMRAPTF